MRKRLFIVFVLVCMFASCKSTKQLTDKSHLETVTETTEQVQVSNDSLNLVQNTNKTTKENTVATDETKIIFSENGGSYNVFTGQADNVSSVSKNAKIEAFKEQISELKTTIDYRDKRISNLKDSINFLAQQNDIVSVEKTESDNWWKWLLSGVAIGAVLLIFLKKFPYTKPFFFWL